MEVELETFAKEEEEEDTIDLERFGSLAPKSSR
jgi:hypothetical protein